MVYCLLILHSPFLDLFLRLKNVKRRLSTKLLPNFSLLARLLPAVCRASNSTHKYDSVSFFVFVRCEIARFERSCALIIFAIVESQSNWTPRISTFHNDMSEVTPVCRLSTRVRHSNRIQLSRATCALACELFGTKPVSPRRRNLSTTILHDRIHK